MNRLPNPHLEPIGTLTYLQQHPDATPAEVVSGLAEQGTRVNAKLVVIVIGQITAAARLRRLGQSEAPGRT
jgi:hypothetical protein